MNCDIKLEADEIEKRLIDLAWFLQTNGILSRSKIAEITGYTQKELNELYRLWEKK